MSLNSQENAAVDLVLENLRLKQLVALADKLIEGWDFEHSKDVDGVRHKWCTILTYEGWNPGDPEPECTCGLWEAQKEYYELKGE